MKDMKQFEEATLELVLFGFDVLTTSGLDDESKPETNGPYSASDTGTNSEDSWWK